MESAVLKSWKFSECIHFLVSCYGLVKKTFYSISVMKSTYMYYFGNTGTYPKYAWISSDWYPPRWYAFGESKIDVKCSERELAEF